MAYRWAPGFFYSLRRLPWLVIFLSLAVGYNTMSHASNAHQESFRIWQSTAEAKVQIQGWITPDMVLADAVKLFESRGFSCEGGKLLPLGDRSFITCMYSAPSLPPSNQSMVSAPPLSINWVITLHSSNGATVTDFRIQRFPDDTATPNFPISPKNAGDK